MSSTFKYYVWKHPFAFTVRLRGRHSRNGLGIAQHLQASREFGSISSLAGMPVPHSTTIYDPQKDYAKPGYIQIYTVFVIHLNLFILIYYNVTHLWAGVCHFRRKLSQHLGSPNLGISQFIRGWHAKVLKTMNWSQWPLPWKSQMETDGSRWNACHMTPWYLEDHFGSANRRE